VAALLSILLVGSYKITEAKAHEIREETERRRRERAAPELATAGGTP
jgi:Na+/melibiose symporter-like transporter